MKLMAYNLITMFTAGMGAFLTGLAHKKTQACRDHDMRVRMKEHCLDQMICDSFPASDPPSTY